MGSRFLAGTFEIRTWGKPHTHKLQVTDWPQSGRHLYWIYIQLPLYEWLPVKAFSPYRQNILDIAYVFPCSEHVYTQSQSQKTLGLTLEAQFKPSGVVGAKLIC